MRTRQYIRVLIVAAATCSLCACSQPQKSTGELVGLYQSKVDEHEKALIPYSYSEQQVAARDRLMKMISDGDAARKNGADRPYDAALKEYEKVYGADDPHMSRPLHRVIELSFEKERWTEAEAYARRFLATRDKWMGTTSSDAAESVCDISRALRGQGKVEAAAQEISARLELMKQQPRENCAPGLVLLLCEQAENYRTLHRDADAIACVDQAIAVRKLIPRGIKAPPRMDDLIQFRHRLAGAHQTFEGQN